MSTALQSHTAPAGLAPGTTIAGFVVEALVSRTRHASVYRATRGSTRAAIKILEPAAWPANGEARALRERHMQRSVAHPAVARLLDFGVLVGGSPYVVSEWIDGVSLETRLSSGPMAWPEVLPVLRALAEGLSAIHGAGIVHRDIKPSNLMLPGRPERLAVILDFGHSLALGDVRLTTGGEIFGSPAYMAPEQAADRPLDGRADLYALGVVLYRALTGSLPFDCATPSDFLRCHQCEPVAPPRRRAPSCRIPQEAEDVCLWLLAKDPRLRVPSANVLAATLRVLEGGS